MPEEMKESVNLETIHYDGKDYIAYASIIDLLNTLQHNTEDVEEKAILHDMLFMLVSCKNKNKLK